MPASLRLAEGFARAMPAFLLIVIGACSQEGEVDADDIRNLLLKAPYARVFTDSEIVPSVLSQWGDRDAGGWAPGLRSVDRGGRTSVLMAGKLAAIDIVTTGARERELEVVAWAFGSPEDMQLTLNGVPLATIELGPKASASKVVVPAAFWKAGRNRLEFSRAADADAASKVHVSRLRITPAADAKVSHGQVALDTGTEVAWRLELAGSAVLDFQLEGSSAGLASVILESFDPLTGGVGQLTKREFPFQRKGPAEGRLVVPDPEGMVLQIRITWTSDDERSSLKVELLKLLEQKPLTRPPILFVSIDTLSAHNLSAYGYERPTTPNLAAFAEDSVLFETARSNAPWTIPSYASQFTGVYSWANKRKKKRMDVPHFAWDSYRVPERRWTLGEMLRSAGYTTGAFVDNLWLARVPGFSQGFDTYNTEAALISRDDPEGGMRMVFPDAVEFLEDHAGTPVFVFAQIVDVHGPYSPGAPFKGRFRDDIDPDSITRLPVVRSTPSVFGGISEAIARGRFEGDLPSSVGAEYFQADYDEKILEMDAALGDLLEELKRKGLYDDLLIIFSADHGESMDDHDFFFRHGIAYDSAIHVPLIVKMPGQVHGGKRVTSPVQLVDIYPTLLDVLGLPSQRPFLHGRSILPAIEDGSIEDVALMSQSEILEHCALTLGRWKLVSSEPLGIPLDSMLTSPGLQARLFEESPRLFTSVFGQDPPVGPNQVLDLIVELKENNPALIAQIKKRLYGLGPSVELYDTVADPEESNDVSSEYPEIVAEMSELMRLEREKADQMRIEDDAPEIRLDAEMLGELRNLGYVGDD